MKKNILSFFLAISLLLNLSAQNPVNHTYTKTDGPDKNPLKGWNSGWWNQADFATVGFQYLKWKDFEPTDGVFNFDAVEDVLNRPGSNGKHFILRLYADWFGNNATSDACPQWIYNDYNVARLQAPNGKYITDFNNQAYITQAIEAITALANHFKNDERAYAFQLGVLGYWGEWHAFSYNDDNFEITDATKNQILTAYKTNFTTIKLMGRYPWKEPLASSGGIGFHNDYFGPNGHSDEFDDAIFSDNKWLEGPVGGEIPPDLNDDDYTEMYSTTRGINMVERGHYSTMKGDSPCNENPTSSNCNGFMAMHRKMGYNYQIENALFADTLLSSENLSVTLSIKNIGVAPMYYNWDVQFALLNQNTNEVVKLYDVDYNLQTILSDDTLHSISMDYPLTGVADNVYKLAVRFLQPNADDAKSEAWKLDVRNTYILFSNDMPTVSGVWKTDNSLKGGWSILGDVTVSNSTLNTDTTADIENKIKIYPNPSNKNLNISKPENLVLQKVNLYDIMGRLLKVYNLKEMAIKKQIDISALSTGHYFLVFESKTSLIKKGFIKE